MEKGKMIATRDGFGDEIVEVGKENKNIYVVDVDIGKSCKTAAPKRSSSTIPATTLASRPCEARGALPGCSKNKGRRSPTGPGPLPKLAQNWPYSFPNGTIGRALRHVRSKQQCTPYERWEQL